MANDRFTGSRGDFQQMDGTEEPGIERGVLAAPAEVWDRTVQRATVIGQFASLLEASQNLVLDRSRDVEYMIR